MTGDPRDSAEVAAVLSVLALLLLLYFIWAHFILHPPAFLEVL